MREATALACALVLALACAQAQRAELCAEEAEPPAIVNNLDMQAFSDVQSVFNTANLTLIRTGRLRPRHYNKYRLRAWNNLSDADTLLTLSSTHGASAAKLYCRSDWSWSSIISAGRIPAPGSCDWSSELSTPLQNILISRSDPAHEKPGLPSPAGPSLTCSVINDDAHAAVNYTLTARFASIQRTLVQEEQAALAALFDRCCSDALACGLWRQTSPISQRGALGNTDSEGSGRIYTDFCSFWGANMCTPSGHLYRLNVDNYNLNCAWPGNLLAQFSQLNSLSLANNPRLTGTTADMLGTVSGLEGLRFLDLRGNTGLKGSIDSGKANAALCASARRNLVSLDLSAMGLTGSIPGCLYGQGSSIMLLDLGARLTAGANNFTGSLPDIVPADSPLQLFHFDHNQITGTLPASLANARSLVHLNASRNRLAGTIPSMLGNIPTLQYFYVRMNSLEGPIPDSFGTADNLEAFDTKCNALTAMPAAWTNPDSNLSRSYLEFVRASFNSISGPFPAGLASAPKLRRLVLNANKLRGPLPRIPGMFPSLLKMNASYNQLSGGIPPEFATSALFSRATAEEGLNRYWRRDPKMTLFDLGYNRLEGWLPAFLNRTSMPEGMRRIFLKGNNLKINCSDENFGYIVSLCPPPQQRPKQHRRPAQEAQPK